MPYSALLDGAYDIHVHSSPDLISRSQDPVSLLKEARRAKMAGILLKDHTTSTVGRLTAFPFSSPTPKGVSILTSEGRLREECCPVLKLIADHNIVLATGHLSPEESLELIRQASRLGCKKILVTHASESVTLMSPSQQKDAAALGAYIEHCFFAVTPVCPNPVALEEIRDQIRYVGVEHSILSSDLGQVNNPPPVEGLSLYLEKMYQIGFSREEIRQMVRANPKAILADN